MTDLNNEIRELTIDMLETVSGGGSVVQASNHSQLSVRKAGETPQDYLTNRMTEVLVGSTR
jgi:hypothetical protein